MQGLRPCTPALMQLRLLSPYLHAFRPDHRSIGPTTSNKKSWFAMTATAVAVAVDYAPPPPRQGIAALRARHAHSAALRCAWLCAALDPDVNVHRWL